METCPCNVVGYARVSTEDQGSWGVSLDDQRVRILAHCEATGLTLVDLITADESAKSLDRPGLRLCLDALDRGDADGLVVAKIDRLVRDVGDWVDLLRKYFGPGAGKRLHSIADAVDTATATGRLMLLFKVGLAAWERETIVERTQAALDRKKAKGDRTGSVPYGWGLYEAGPRNKHGRPVGLIEIPEEQRVLSLIRAYADLKVTTREIAQRLDEEGIPTKTGRGKWSHSAVAKILNRKERPR